MSNELSSLYQVPPLEGTEREACTAINPAGFYIRHPPPPHNLQSFITPDDQLFHTIHMGAAIINTDKWVLVIDGLVNRPCSISLEQLRRFTKTTVTAFHECYGSPIKPAIENVWRIGNVEWSGVRLSTLLELAGPLPEAKYVWSEGLDYGVFHGVEADRYLKDLPLEKALMSEVLIADEMNGRPLSKERGGPVRLVVPGWFGTNSTKWLSKLSMQAGRAQGPYTTVFYNAIDPEDPEGGLKPVWEVQPNSMIVNPPPGTEIRGDHISVEGWAWSHDGIKSVFVGFEEGKSLVEAHVSPRKEFSWQRFTVIVDVPTDLKGQCVLLARATSISGKTQASSMRRNHNHTPPVAWTDLKVK
ncbi:hypothetical protein IFR05_010718 [Cadophora sp. M221]|nr:hypothetical protein IFR05_010718 [Cadophora sp. M221]